MGRSMITSSPGRP